MLRARLGLLLAFAPALALAAGTFAPALAMAADTFAPALAAAADAPVLRVGMEPRHPPWSYVRGARFDLRRPPALTAAQVRSLVGLDVDFMNALGLRLAARLTVVPTDWYELEAGLLEGRFDLILSAWTPSLATPGSIVASPPYCDWGLLIVARSENKTIHTYADLDGVRVGHLRDPTVDAALEAMGGGRFQVYDRQAELFEAVESGALEAAIYDSVYVRWRVAQDRRLRVVGEPLNRLGYHVGVRKLDADLVRRVQQAVKELVASEEAARIRRKWEGTR